MLKVVIAAAVLVLIAGGCSKESYKRTSYETLQNIREQECSKVPSVECEERERFETYEQQRPGRENTESVVPRK